jgi:exodeoxyribonuclease V gamma subunit
LPIGVFGERALGDLTVRVEGIAGSAVEAMGGPRGERVEIDAALDGTRFVGSLPPVFPRGLVDFRYAKISPKHELRLWLWHLLLNWARGPCRAVLVGRSSKGGADTLTFRPVADPPELLRPLLGLYRDGRRYPLPLFPQTSHVYACERILKRRSEADALRAACTAHTKPDFADGKDAYVQQIYGTTERWREEREGGASFAEVAQLVFAPLLEHRAETSPGETGASPDAPAGRSAR